MKNYFKGFFLFLICIMFAGCSVHQNPAQTKIDTPVGSMKYKCPPGQAKKGNCQSLDIK